MADFFVDRMLSNELIRIRSGNIESELDYKILYDLIAAVEKDEDEKWFLDNKPKKKKIVQEGLVGKGEIRKFIDSKLRISDVAKEYGLVVKKNKAICPFHKDTDPSISFSDEKNVFFCFGCHAKGDIVEFIRKMEEKSDN